MQRSLVLKSAAGVKARIETFEDREHLVVPVIALVEGVVFAMNASAAEYVDASELNAAGWDGRPVFVGHPMKNGRAVSGNTPDVLESKRVGTVFSTKVASKKLKMEAWIDKARAAEIDPDLLDRVANGDPIEISVGIFCETDDTTGEYNGKKFKGAWHNIVPDHLALLPAGHKGACSIDMGCGVRAAQEQSMSEPKKPSFLSRILGALRVAQPAGEMSDSDLRRKLYDALKQTEKNVNYVEAFVPVTNPTRVIYSCYQPALSYDQVGTYTLLERAFTLGDNGVVTLGADVIEVEPVLSYEPVLMAEEPILAEGIEPKDAAGKRNSAKDQAKIQAMHDHSLALGAYCDPIKAAEQKNAGAGAPCSCGHAPKINTEQTEAEMTKEQISKFLETATEDQLKALGAVIEPATPVVEAPKVAAAAPVVEAPKAEAPKTLEQLVAEAPADVRDNFNTGLRIGREKKEATIKALQDTGRCKMSVETLKAMSQAQLDELVELAGNTVRAAIDFGGQGAPRAEAPKAVPPPADLNARVLEARKAK